MAPHIIVSDLPTADLHTVQAGTLLSQDPVIMAAPVVTGCFVRKDEDGVEQTHIIIADAGTPERARELAEQIDRESRR
jgi:hypothetical protein